MNSSTRSGSGVGQAFGAAPGLQPLRPVLKALRALRRWAGGAMRAYLEELVRLQTEERRRPGSVRSYD